MLWHPRCRWPARFSLPPTPRHDPRKKATRACPVIQGRSRNTGCFLVECPKRGDGPKATDPWLSASISRPRRWKASCAGVARMPVKTLATQARLLLPVQCTRLDRIDRIAPVSGKRADRGGRNEGCRSDREEHRGRSLEDLLEFAGNER